MLHNQAVNRVEFDISWWRDKDKNIDNAFGEEVGAAVKQGKNFRKARYEYYRSVHRNYRQRRHTMMPPLTADEKQSLKFLKDAIRYQRRQVYPNRWVRRGVRLYEIAENLTKRVMGASAPVGHFDQVQLARTTNRRELADTMAKNGFNQAIGDLDRHLKEGAPEFKIEMPLYIDKNKSLEYHLQFRRNSEDGTYTLDRYDAHLRHANKPELNRSRSFRMVDGHGITASQAHNLLEGRAVQRSVIDVDGQRTGTWVQLDFNERDIDQQFKLKRFPTENALDLDKAFADMPFRELHYSPGKEILFSSIKNGNTAGVTFDNGNTSFPMFAYADPLNGEMKYLDDKKRPITKQQLLTYSHQPEQGAKLTIQAPIQTQDQSQKLNNRKPQVVKPPKRTRGLGPR